MISKNYLTVQEAADFLGLSVQYIYQLTSGKRVPYYKPFGNRVYFKREELEQFISESRVASAAELEAQAVTYTLNHAK